MPLFGSLFAGIGGFDLGFERSGMKCSWQAETDTQCQSVLRSNFPMDIQRAHDVRHVTTADFVRPDLICGGFPCQDVSVAGRRAGLAGERSGLWWEFHRIIADFRPRWVCIENVPGLLSSNGGRDMGAILRALAELGYGYAYRVLDSQWFGVAQRRRRVFIVGCFGEWRTAAEVLFEPESLPWDSPPSREAGAKTADPITRSFAKHGGASGGKDNYPRNAIMTTHALTRRHDSSEDGCGRGTPIIPFDTTQITSSENRCNPQPGDPSHPLSSQAHAPAIAIQEGAERETLSQGPQGKGYQPNIGYTLESRHHVQSVAHNMSVRRLTPVECERLQGFPDGWTEGHSNSARYRMLGNAVTVNVAEWIGMRLVLSGRL